MKKLIALLLCLIMVVGVLAGCGTGQNDTSISESSSNSIAFQSSSQLPLSSAVSSSIPTLDITLSYNIEDIKDNFIRCMVFVYNLAGVDSDVSNAQYTNAELVQIMDEHTYHMYISNSDMYFLINDSGEVIAGAIFSPGKLALVPPFDYVKGRTHGLAMVYTLAKPAEGDSYEEWFERFESLDAVNEDALVFGDIAADEDVLAACVEVPDIYSMYLVYRQGAVSEEEYTMVEEWTVAIMDYQFVKLENEREELEG